MEIDQKTRLENASQGYTYREGDMNILEIREYLKSLPNADQARIDEATKLELNELLTDALTKAESETSTPAKPKSLTVAKISEVKTDTYIKINPKLPLFTDIADELNANTIIQTDLNSLILKYFKSSIKIEYTDGEISYLTQDYFDQFETGPGMRSPLFNTANIDICGILELKNPRWMFKKCQVETIRGNVILIGIAISMFEYTFKLNSDMSSWDVSRVTDMLAMFENAIYFNSDLSKWDVSKVENMSRMFNSAHRFNSDISSWDVSRVTDMSSMFRNAAFFNSDLSKWDISKVENMSSMFNSALRFDSDISRWNVSKVTNMSRMFNFARRFNSDIGRWNVSKVKDMHEMFSNAESFDANLSGWKLSRVNDTHEMFKRTKNSRARVIKLGRVFKILYT